MSLKKSALRQAQGKEPGVRIQEKKTKGCISILATNPFEMERNSIMQATIDKEKVGLVLPVSASVIPESAGGGCPESRKWEEMTGYRNSTSSRPV